MTEYSITTRDADRLASEAIAIDHPISREFACTETQAAVARLALREEDITVGEIAEEVDANERYVSEILEYADTVQLADMVLEDAGYDMEHAWHAGDDSRLSELYDERLPELVMEGADA